MALASAGKASPDQDFWDIEYLQLSELLVKTHKAANGVRDDDIVLGMFPSPPAAQFDSCLNLCVHVQPVPEFFRDLAHWCERTVSPCFCF